MPLAPSRALITPRTATAAVGAFAPFLSIAAGTALCDVATKAWAVHALGGGGRVPLVPGLSLRLVFNTASAGGVWIGEHTVALNALATMLAVVLTTVVVAPLTRLDRLAPVTLGLIAGGAAGNLASLLAGPAGVADFLAFGYPGGALVLNVADVAVLAGLALLVRGVARVTSAIRRLEAR